VDEGDEDERWASEAAEAEQAEQAEQAKAAGENAEAVGVTRAGHRPLSSLEDIAMDVDWAELDGMEVEWA